MEPPDETAPTLQIFQTICPTCGRDSDAEDTEFRFVAEVPFSGSEYILAAVTCGACDTRQDLALWPVDTTALEAAVKEQGNEDPAESPLRARYEGLVAGYREQWEGLLAAQGEIDLRERVLDLTGSTVAVSTSRQTVVDMRVLAAAQACRQVALRSLGQEPAGSLLAGPFRCILSLDRADGASRWGLLHLSVSHALGLGALRRLEAVVLTGLYFTGDERPFLHEEPGQRVPCVHFRLALAEAGETQSPPGAWA